jgi:CDP-diacylglycerol--serine O-phosphatidyltransferase
MSHFSALNLPNILTLSNLFCGCCAILYLFQGDPATAASFTFASFLLDYGDGMAARALKIQSELGKQLDSLADVVSFGVVPGSMLYLLLANTNYEGGMVPLVTWAMPAFIVSAFSGLRLGLFNLDKRQTTYFLGLSTPATTVFVMGVTLAAYENRLGFGDWLLQNKWLVYALIPILSILLISEVPMFGLKLRKKGWASNWPLVLVLSHFVGSYLLFGPLALSLTVLLYTVLSVLLRWKVLED